MGFPRILSKANKVYTKLGEFCLSSDGNNFWIVCHTCQEELQTQDQFWKHIQDEHNFMHAGLFKEEKPSLNYIDGSENNPTPLYRKTVDDEQQCMTGGEHEDSGATGHDEKTAKEFVEIGMEIKTEPHSMGRQTAVSQAPSTSLNSNMVGALGLGAGHVDVTATPTLYQLPQVPSASAYAALVQQHVSHVNPPLPPSALSMAAAAMGSVGVSLSAPGILKQELPKDSNSTNASAGSAAVSSDDGERWYICDYETCGLKFKYQSRLELHRSVHSKERRFACEICGASFKQSCNLSTHRKKKHSLKGLKGSSSSTQQRF